MKIAKQRKIKNYLLRPDIQIKLGVYFIVLSLLFSSTVLTILYAHIKELLDSTLALTDIEEDLRPIFQQHFENAQLWILFCTTLFLIANVALGIIFSHKMVGPVVAFKKHIKRLKEFDFTAKTNLRKGDSFTDVADELNELSEVLKSNYNLSDSKISKASEKATEDDDE